MPVPTAIMPWVSARRPRDLRRSRKKSATMSGDRMASRTIVHTNTESATKAASPIAATVTEVEMRQ